jgi:hypothetical protein
LAIQALFWDKIQIELFGTITKFISVYEYTEISRKPYVINLHTIDKPNLTMGDKMTIFKLPYYHLSYHFQDCTVRSIRKTDNYYETKIYSENMDFALNYKVKFIDCEKDILVEDYTLVYSNYGKPESMSYDEFKEKLMAVKL